MGGREEALSQIRRTGKSQGCKVPQFQASPRAMGREHIRVAQPAPDKGVASRHQHRSRLKLSKDQRLEPKEEVLSVEIARFLAAREGPNAGGDGVSMCVGCCMAERSRKLLFPQQGATGVMKGWQNPPRSSSWVGQFPIEPPGFYDQKFPWLETPGFVGTMAAAAPRLSKVNLKFPARIPSSAGGRLRSRTTQRCQRLVFWV